LEGRFFDHNDREDLAGAVSEKDSPSQTQTSTLEVSPVRSLKAIVLGMPIDDLVCRSYSATWGLSNLMQDGVLRDARYVIQHFSYTNNPYDQPERGIMTYQRARHIVQHWHTLGSNYMKPYLTRYRLHGTTILERLVPKMYSGRM
jgi:hypothetical protein